MFWVALVWSVLSCFVSYCSVLVLYLFGLVRDLLCSFVVFVVSCVDVCVVFLVCALLCAQLVMYI